METFESRKQIRSRVLARMGKSSNDDQAQQVMAQLNEFIRAAAMQVYDDCKWVQSITTARVDVGIDQTAVNYPDYCGPTNVGAIAIWDDAAKVYLPLQRRKIGLSLTDDPVVEVGGADLANNRSRPDRFECRKQIMIWPRPDQTYELKIEYHANPALDNDETVSIVDAELIILWTLADAFGFDGDGATSQEQRLKYQQRLGKLNALQNNVTQFRRGSYDRQQLRRKPDGYRPNSGSWPSRVEDQQ